jgi:hypothetical protein
MAQTSKIGRHMTKIFDDKDGYTNIQYHDTVIVSFNPFGIILDSNGYRTQTTKTRMNQTASQFDLDFYVYQQDGKWYVNQGIKTVEFVDGMRLIRS